MTDYYCVREKLGGGDVCGGRECVDKSSKTYIWLHAAQEMLAEIRADCMNIEIEYNCSIYFSLSPAYVSHSFDLPGFLNSPHLVNESPFYLTYSDKCFCMNTFFRWYDQYYLYVLMVL